MCVLHLNLQINKTNKLFAVSIDKPCPMSHWWSSWMGLVARMASRKALSSLRHVVPQVSTTPVSGCSCRTRHASSRRSLSVSLRSRMWTGCKLCARCTCRVITQNVQCPILFGAYIKRPISSKLNGIQTTFKRHSNGIQTTFKRHSNDIQTTFQRHSNSIQTTFIRHSNQIQTAFKRQSTNGMFSLFVLCKLS